MISHPYRCIFVHIPKTGGTSIEDLLWPSEQDRTVDNLWRGLNSKYGNKYQTGGLQHLKAVQIRQEVGSAVFDRYYKFTIVRNPWDRVISQFVYMRKRPDLRRFVGMEADDTLARYLSIIQKQRHVQWEPQYEFFLDENGEQLVDFIGRLESIEDDVRTVLDRIQFNAESTADASPVQLPHAKKGNRSHYRTYFDDETSQMVEEMYKRDIELLGYSFA